MNDILLDDQTLFYLPGETYETDFAIRRLSLDFGEGLQVQVLYPDEGAYSGMEYTDEHKQTLIAKRAELATLVCWYRFPKEAA